MYNDSFTSSLPIWLSFISFSCPITVARTSNNRLIRSSQSVHLSFVPDFSGKAFGLSPLSNRLTMGLP